MKKDIKIIIVEDEIIVAQDIKEILEKLGYEVCNIFTKGEDALNYLEKNRIDCIIMDIMLRGKIDGIDAANIIKSQFKTPIIFLTAYSDQDTLERAKLTEPYGYILKPYQEKELYTNIEIAIHKNKLERQIEENEKWISAILNSIGDAIIATDAKGYIKFMNPVAERLTGWSVEDATGKKMNTLFRIMHEQDSTDYNEKIMENDNIKLSENLILTDRNGKSIRIHENATPIRNDKGEIEGIVLVFHKNTR